MNHWALPIALLGEQFFERNESEAVSRARCQTDRFLTAESVSNIAQ